MNYDFSKAFNTIIMNCYWANFLQTIFLKINTSSSEELTTPSGVPQGSILGPVSYSVSIADFSSTLLLGWNFHCCADDLQSFDPEEYDNTIDELNVNLLQQVAEWEENNGLKLNARKTQLICFETRGVDGIVRPVVVVLIMLWISPTVSRVWVSFLTVR